MCQGGKNGFFLKYQMRYAAGFYWLLSMEQEGEPYVRPLSLSKTGARIWNLLSEGKHAGQIAEQMAREYEIAKGDALADVADFLGQLQKAGIITGEACNEMLK